MSNPPLDPPPFDPPMIRKCIRTNVRIQDHDDLQEVLILTTVICTVESQLNPTPQRSYNSQQEDDGEAISSGEEDYSGYSETSEDDESDDDAAENGDAPQSIDAKHERYKMKAFWLRKEPICENHHGIFTTYIFYAKVLHKADLYWTTTNEEVAIKTVSWRCIKACENHLSEDFVKEISALQYLSKWKEAEMPGKSICDMHVITADTVMCDECNVYMIMPFCNGKDLCYRVAEVERFSEDQSRYWFKQILKGLEILQKAGICHRDISPENFGIIDEKSLVLDFGMCLRIPYNDDQMHLISPQHPCGKLPHMAPEIFRQLPFDGYASDIWGAGTVLLFMLTGKRMSNPPLFDRAFEGIELGLSCEATDLLRKIFRLDPKDRLTLEQIQRHPFVTYEFLCQR